ncbi:hypothetical protein Tco_0040603 [Tanacetum coccineum]
MSNSNTNLQTQSSNALHNAIMEAGSKDRPPMLAPGNYVQWKSRIKRYIDTKPNSELIHYSLQNPPYIYQWAEKTVPVAEGSSETTTERYMENYKNVSQDIRDQMNAEAEAVQIILTGIDNDIYSTVDACPNACEMWKAIERLKQGESINVQDLETNLYWEFGKFTSRDGESLESYYSRFYKMMNELVRNQCNVTNHQVNVQFLLQLQPEWQRFVTLVKQSQELKTVSYHKLYDILKQHQNEVNEIRTERLARTANPLALVAQQQPVYHHGTRIESGFKRAFATLFGQDVETFIGTMFLNMDQLEKQLDKEEFQEIGSTASFKVLETQFQMFIKSRIYLDDEYVDMTCNKFLQYTRLEIPEFRDTLIQHMESVKKSIDERAQHNESADSWGE